MVGSHQTVLDVSYNEDGEDLPAALGRKDQEDKDQGHKVAMTDLKMQGGEEIGIMDIFTKMLAIHLTRVVQTRSGKQLMTLGCSVACLAEVAGLG